MSGQIADRLRVPRLTAGLYLEHFGPKPPEKRDIADRSAQRDVETYLYTYSALVAFARKALKP